MFLIASAVAVALQVEAGASVMHKQMDDTYIEYRLPDGIERDSFTTLAFGAGVKLSDGAASLTLGWRNLGNQRTNAGIVDDNIYWPCMHDSSKCKLEPKPYQQWLSDGDVQQVYAEFAYGFRVSQHWRIAPVLGIAENRIQWHTNIYSIATGQRTLAYQSKREQQPGPYAGIEAQRGPFSVGALYLDTKPNTSLAHDPCYPGQGPSSVLLRVTYSFGL